MEPPSQALCMEEGQLDTWTGQRTKGWGRARGGGGMEGLGERGEEARIKILLQIWDKKLQPLSKPSGWSFLPSLHIPVMPIFEDACWSPHVCLWFKLQDKRGKSRKDSPLALRLTPNHMTHLQLIQSLCGRHMCFAEKLENTEEHNKTHRESKNLERSLSLHTQARRGLTPLILGERGFRPKPRALCAGRSHTSPRPSPGGTPEAPG